MRNVKRFQLKEGGAPPTKLHPALQLLNIWMLTDPEGEPVLGFVELRGHWCPINESCLSCSNHAHQALNKLEYTDTTISINIETIDAIEPLDNATLYWINGRQTPLRVFTLGKPFLTEVP